jgi:hypothetical protein
VAVDDVINKRRFNWFSPSDLRLLSALHTGKRCNYSWPGETRRKTVEIDAHLDMRARLAAYEWDAGARTTARVPIALARRNELQFRASASAISQRAAKNCVSSGRSAGDALAFNCGPLNQAERCKVVGDGSGNG